MAFELTDTNFQQEALEKAKVAVVDFWAEWCGPCRLIGTIVEELSKEYDGRVLVGKVNVDDNPEVSMEYGIRSIPTILILKDGQVVDRHVGTLSKHMLATKIEAQLS